MTRSVGLLIAGCVFALATVAAALFAFGALSAPEGAVVVFKILFIGGVVLALVAFANAAHEQHIRHRHEHG